MSRFNQHVLIRIVHDKYDIGCCLVGLSSRFIEEGSFVGQSRSSIGCLLSVISLLVTFL